MNKLTTKITKYKDAILIFCLLFILYPNVSLLNYIPLLPFLLIKTIVSLIIIFMGTSIKSIIKVPSMVVTLIYRFRFSENTNNRSILIFIKDSIKNKKIDYFVLTSTIFYIYAFIITKINNGDLLSAIFENIIFGLALIILVKVFIERDKDLFIKISLIYFLILHLINFLFIFINKNNSSVGWFFDNRNNAFRYTMPLIYFLILEVERKKEEVNEIVHFYHKVGIVEKNLEKEDGKIHNILKNKDIFNNNVFVKAKTEKCGNYHVGHLDNKGNLSAKQLISLLPCGDRFIRSDYDLYLIISLIILISILFVSIYSGALTTSICFLILIPYVIFLSHKDIKFFNIYIYLGIILVTFIFFTIPPINREFTSKIIVLFGKSESANGRFLIYDQIINAIQKGNIVFGNGIPKLYEYLNEVNVEKVEVVLAHSLYLDIFYKFGIIGTLIFISIIIVIINEINKSMNVFIKNIVSIFIFIILLWSIADEIYIYRLLYYFAFCYYVLIETKKDKNVINDKVNYEKFV